MPNTFITHFNITWEVYGGTVPGTPVVWGRFIAAPGRLGEPWVVGPVTLVSVSHEFGNTTHVAGTGILTRPSIANGMFSSVNYQYGLPEVGPYYDATMDFSRPENLPKVLQIGDLVMSTTGQDPAGSGLGYQRSHLNEATALTVLSAPAPAGSFRPALFSSTPRAVTHNISNVSWNALARLAPVPATPSRESLLRLLPELPWFEFWDAFKQTQNGPANNCCVTEDLGSPHGVIAGDYAVGYPNGTSVYGIEIIKKFAPILLWLQTVPEGMTPAEQDEYRLPVLIRVIQIGLDIISFIREGGVKFANGGHAGGRKAPAVLAALMFKDYDPELTSWVNNTQGVSFAEDMSTWFITADDVGRENDFSASTLIPPDNIESASEFRTDQIGIAWYGFNHMHSPSGDNAILGGGGYPATNLTVLPGGALAIELMGGKATWNWPAFFGAVQYWVDTTGWATHFSATMAGQMWTAYKTASPNAPTISLRGRTYDSGKSIVLATTSPGSEIFFTWDGSQPGGLGTTPSGTSLRYTGPIARSTSGTLRAVTVREGDASLAVAETYVFDPSKAAPPTLLEVHTNPYPDAPLGTPGDPATTSLVVDWDYTQAAADGFRLYTRPSLGAGAYTLAKTVGPEVRSTTLTGLNYGTSYDVEMASFNENGEYARVGPLTAYTPPEFGPTTLAATEVLSTAISVGFTPTAGVSNYQGYYRTTGSSVWIKGPESFAHVCKFTGLNSSTSYDFMVRGYLVNPTTEPSYSPGSATVSATTIASGVFAGYDNQQFTTGSAPAGYSFVEYGGTSPTVTWGDIHSSPSFAYRAHGMACRVVAPVHTAANEAHYAFEAVIVSTDNYTPLVYIPGIAQIILAGGTLRIHAWEDDTTWGGGLETYAVTPAASTPFGVSHTYWIDYVKGTGANDTLLRIIWSTTGVKLVSLTAANSLTYMSNITAQATGLVFHGAPTSEGYITNINGSIYPL
jgi:hypothetical protein